MSPAEPKSCKPRHNVDLEAGARLAPFKDNQPSAFEELAFESHLLRFAKVRPLLTPPIHFTTSPCTDLSSPPPLSSIGITSSTIARMMQPAAAATRRMISGEDMAERGASGWSTMIQKRFESTRLSIWNGTMNWDTG
jgi:hypothetical protein